MFYITCFNSNKKLSTLLFSRFSANTASTVLHFSNWPNIIWPEFSAWNWVRPSDSETRFVISRTWPDPDRLSICQDRRFRRQTLHRLIPVYRNSSTSHFKNFSAFEMLFIFTRSFSSLLMHKICLQLFNIHFYRKLKKKKINLMKITQLKVYRIIIMPLKNSLTFIKYFLLILKFSLVDFILDHRYNKLFFNFIMKIYILNMNKPYSFWKH